MPHVRPGEAQARSLREAAARKPQPQQKFGKPGPKKPQPKPEKHKHSRLPHGATFEVQYDATLKLWRGALTIPVADEKKLIFTGDANNVFGLLEKLDKRYRKSLIVLPAISDLKA